MKTWNRLCIKSYTVTDKIGQSFTVERGKEYLTSGEKDGAVTVFSKYWVPVPAIYFAGEEPFT